MDALLAIHEHFDAKERPPPQHFQRYRECRVPFTAAEREALLAQAESQIRQTVGSLGVLQTAQDTAALYLQRLLRFAGYTKVGITFSPQLN